jgi:MIP family channel proteins
MKTTLRHFLAEFVGIFALVFVGGGAIMMAQMTTSTAGLVTVALAHGLILALMVSSTMNVSGGHLNPAITLGLLSARRITASMAGVHVLAQLAGAVIAAMALKATMPTSLVIATHAGGQSIATDVNTMQAIVLEGIATFFLMFVIYGTAVSTMAPKIGGLAIGLTIAADIMAIGPLTGASMNPARSFGPALVSGVWEAQAIYWIGPIVGAVLAAQLWEQVLLEKPGA